MNRKIYPKLGVSKNYEGQSVESQEIQIKVRNCQNSKVELFWHQCDECDLNAYYINLPYTK